MFSIPSIVIAEEPSQQTLGIKSHVPYKAMLTVSADNFSSYMKK